MASNTPKTPKALAEARPKFVNNPVHHPTTGPHPGRQPKDYSEPVHDKIMELIRQGNRPVQAARLAGIPESQHYYWLQEGKKNHPILWKYSDGVAEALATFEKSALDVITNGGDFNGDPELALKMLERIFPGAYSLNVATKMEAASREFFNRLEQALPPEIFAQVIAAASGTTTTLPPTTATIELIGSDEEEDGE